MYKLIVCSVDDTLLTNNHTLSEDTKEALLQSPAGRCTSGSDLTPFSAKSEKDRRKTADEYV